MLYCENCQKGVNTTGEMDGCRCCSKPPPPPSKSARPTYVMPPDDEIPTPAQMRAQDAESDEYAEFKRTKRASIPPFTTLGARLRAAQGLPDQTSPT